MTPKSAAFLALVGMLLLTVMLVADFITIATGFAGDVVPAAALLRSLIGLSASVCVTVFFFIFQKA